MRRPIAIFMIFLSLVNVNGIAQPANTQELGRWEMQAKRVTIIRDNWGIPHVYGHTDADAVFGLLYAQCEDDFSRVEMNYIEKLGRTAEVKGQSALYADLMIRLMIDSNAAITDYQKAAPWLKKLLVAFADGINFYLYKHPEVKPALLNKFQPWYPLLWTDGSIGAISTAGISETELKDFYTGSKSSPTAINYSEENLTGSNGFAFSPKITASGNSILYINPHVSFYFRPEVHMISEEGLNAYGAVTWGQFFIYQGFNEHCGWMHTSSGVDIADLYAEKIAKTPTGYSYLYNNRQVPVIKKTISISYHEVSGGTEEKRQHHGAILIPALFTHHGPVMAERNGQWLSLKANNRSITSLIQSWQRTKANSFAAYKKVMALNANTSNNTVYADAEGNIAYWHGNFIPIRDKKFNWSKPVDGTSTATEWKGLHPVEQTVHLYNPPNGWLQNCNSTPFTVAGKYSPNKKDYPAYMAPDAENFRGINAVRVLDAEKKYTLDKVIAAGYDSYIAAFEQLIPALLSAYEKNHDTLLEAPIALLKKWNLRCAANSIETTLAIEWGQKILPAIMKSDAEEDDAGQVEKTAYFARTATSEQLLQPFKEVITELGKNYGTWQVPWGSINRFQRVSNSPEPSYDDAQPSYPVAFVSSTWGMLPGYNSRYYKDTHKRIGIHGNSFICAVEFGKKIKAKSLLAGGESGHPDSKHFSDQALMYSKGQFKEVLFYKEDVLKHAEKNYHPGEE
ncbi:MAG: peptidase penicillin amidase [Ferruginibacter sp.]|nr:peptidase penicillin amidase [Ferruginibacter sp.]